MTLGSDVGGTFTVSSGDSTNGDNIETDAVTSFGGDIMVNLGEGTNSAMFLGVMAGNNVRYDGGGGSDSVSFGLTGNPSDVNIILGTGDDLFTLEAGASISPTTLRVDFGGGDDALVNNFGQFTFVMPIC